MCKVPVSPYPDSIRSEIKAASPSHGSTWLRTHSPMQRSACSMARAPGCATAARPRSQQRAACSCGAARCTQRTSSPCPSRCGPAWRAATRGLPCAPRSRRCWRWAPTTLCSRRASTLKRRASPQSTARSPAPRRAAAAAAAVATAALEAAAGLLRRSRRGQQAARRRGE
ncbi:MAG: hypothetical protein J3K34DRAFT_281211 [Monoraphidium minutum]|nr:MAG: hypothetical protein J3K34DRAFT_281211 [Monoraphidium minutum]